MADWTDQLLDNLAAEIGLGPKTVEACRRVLVPHPLPDGTVGVEQGVDVAKELGTFSSAISRSVSKLKQKLVEKGDIGEKDFQVERITHIAQKEDSRDVAVQRTRELYGDLTITEAHRGQTYIGKPLVRTPQHLVQSTGRSGEAVIHDLAKLARVPDMNVPVIEVKYPSRGGMAEVQETVPGQVRGGRGR